MQTTTAACVTYTLAPVLTGSGGEMRLVKALLLEARARGVLGDQATAGRALVAGANH